MNENINREIDDIHSLSAHMHNSDRSDDLISRAQQIIDKAERIKLVARLRQEDQGR